MIYIAILVLENVMIFVNRWIGVLIFNLIPPPNLSKDRINCALSAMNNKKYKNKLIIKI